MSTELRQALEHVARRFRHQRLWTGLAVCWMAWTTLGLLLFVFVTSTGKPLGPLEPLLGTFAALAVATAAACAFWAFRFARDPRWVARQIEQRHPELGTGLLAAVEEVATTPPAALGYLQNAVIRQALQHRRTHDWDETVSTSWLRTTQFVHVVALVLLVVVLGALAGQARTQAEFRSLTGPVADSAEVKVDPGSTELERGTTLLVVARFNKRVPPDANLVVEDASRATARRAMTRSLEDPTFAGRVESVESDLSYRVEFQGRATETYRVRVFEYPALERTDAHLLFPRYTGIEPKTVEDIRHVTAVEGTELTLFFHLNKDVEKARLVGKEGETIALAHQDGGDHLYRATMTLTDTKRFRVELVDKDGRANKETAEIIVNVTRNRPAVVKMTQPARDVRVSPIEELKLKANLDDDFGVTQYGVSYAAGGEDPRDLVLSGKGKTSRGVKAEHMLNFEALNAAPDQLVTYFFWAEDIGPDGKPRRTSGDMYFAEVRHFEEIFRQGEAPPSGSAENEEQQQGNAQQAQRLAELQKEIINGTWKVIRRETGAKPSELFVADSKTLQESQQSALQQAAQLAERLRDATSKANLEKATSFMKEAEKHLGGAVKGPSIAAHRPALAAEQSAYQALLKLRAREFEVTRSRSRQRQQAGQQSAGSPSQRQLDQLELTNEENRYEEQRTARPQSQREREQRETRQVVNRLRELAQRQSDLNDRLKELQSALEAAKTADARDEIQRQLKRLREQEQQILRDTDELRERMEREENRERMAEARQQMEQGREHVRQASEALEQGRVAQAVTEGARAGRQLNDTREELRKNASNRFSEEMTEMRGEARRLDEDQKKLSEKIDAPNQQPQRSLRDTGDRKQVREGLEQQRKRLDQLVDRMRSTVQDAEETEPLLAKGLYDAVRKVDEQKVPDALKAAEQLVDLGVNEEAAKASRHAGQGIEQLREGVERAAKSVLGDETAALRRAQSELDDLADQVNREVAQATGRNPAEQQRNSRQGDPSGRRPQAGNPPQGQQGEREGQPGDQAGEQDAQDPPQGAGEQDPQGRQQRAGQDAAKAKGKGQRGQQGRQPQGQQKGQRGQQGQGQQKGQGGQQRQDQQGQQEGQGGQQGQGGLRAGNNQRGGAQRPQGQQAGAQQGGAQAGGVDRLIDGFRRGGPGGLIVGEGFRQWSDRMRDVEELLDDPALRAETARIRDRVRGTRDDFKRHSKVPDWNKLQDMVVEPLAELRKRIAEEVRRRESPDALVPIDRDPVPPQFAEDVRRYYERLGSGR